MDGSRFTIAALGVQKVATMPINKALEGGRSLSRIFTRPLFAEIARAGTAAPVLRLLASLGIPVSFELDPGTLFDNALAVLKLNYRCEYVYKAAIADRIVFGKHSPRTAGLQLELPVGNSIVDAAVFNGSSTAYEIKTEFDSHKRLITQTPDYLKAFERVYVVTHPALAERYAAVLDRDVGLLALNQRGHLTELRPAVPDLGRIQPLTLFNMLRRSEYCQLVEQHFGPQPALPNGLISRYFRRYFRQLTPEQAHAGYVKAMRARTTGERYAAYVLQLPKSLRVLGYATPLSGVQQEKLLQALA